MAQLAELIVENTAERRTVPRSELCLGVTLRADGDDAIIPGEIANLSATGFLVYMPEGLELAEFLDVDLPNAGRRKAQVVWLSGRTAGCNFTAPLGKADVSAARLKSDYREPESAIAAPSLDPVDPIWDVSNEATADEKLPLRTRMLLIVAAGALPWLSFTGIAALLL